MFWKPIHINFHQHQRTPFVKNLHINKFSILKKYPSK
jgi:hypothetical protein